MNNCKKNYKILAVGDIQLQAVKNLQAEKLFAQNYNVIEEIWQKTSKKTGGKLFNGAVLSFISINKKQNKIKVVAHFVEYKNYLAQSKQSDLKLGIKLVGVSGIIILEEKGINYIVFAKRTNNVTEYPGFFELVPSGSIDKECVNASGVVSFQSKLLSEFAEETGLPKNYVEDISGFAFVLDTNHNVYDICCKILLKAKKESVAKKFLGSKEYSKPEFVSINNLNSFIRKNAATIVPTSMAILEAYIQNNFAGKI